MKLVREGYPTITREMKTTYRWGDSFFSDFIWLFYGAPLAWTIDFLTGTVWDYDKIDLITFPGKKEIEPLKPPALIAIAPPQNEYELLSNEAGERLLGISQRRFGSSKILDFDQTHNLFVQYGYSNDSKTPSSGKDDLYEELGASHILESEVTKDRDKVIIKSKLTDVFTEKEVEAYTDTLSASQFDYANPSPWNRWVNFLLGLVPNTVSFDLSSPAATLYTSDNYTLSGSAETTSSAISILSNIGFKSLDSSKMRKGIKGVFKFIPVITAAYQRYNFTAQSGTNFTSNYNFDWVSVLAGAGPEAGLDTSIGYFYFELAPVLSLDWVAASANGGQDTSARGSSLSLYLEAGYQIFVSSRVNLRLFTRFESVPTDPWSHVLTQIRGQSTNVDSINQTAAGFSFGYYFPEDRIILKRAFFPY